MWKRNLHAMVYEALADTPVVFVNGARQTGKSTLVRAIADDLDGARLLDLDEGAALAAAAADPAGFLAYGEGLTVIDEVQRVPDLFLALKATVDRDRRPGRFLLTGSADVLLLPELSGLLAGRMEVLTLWPLSQDELGGREGRFVDALFSTPFSPRSPPSPTDGADSSVIRRALVGGFPEPLGRAKAHRRAAWFRSYAVTVLQREVRSLAQIDDLSAFPRLLALLAARAGGLLNTAELSRASGIPRTTLDRYLGLLRTTFLLSFLPAWSTNLGKRLVRSPKQYLVDTGLLAALTGLSEDRVQAHAELRGPLVESFVFGELSKQITWSRSAPTLHHFRTHAGSEVDFLLEAPTGEVVGVEVKARRSVRSGDFRSLRGLRKDVPHRFRRGVVLYDGEEALSFGEDLYAVPISSLWRY